MAYYGCIDQCINISMSQPNGDYAKIFCCSTDACNNITMSFLNEGSRLIKSLSVFSFSFSFFFFSYIR